MATKAEIAQQLDRKLRELYQKAYNDPTQANIDELNRVLVDPERSWYHYTPGHAEMHGAEPFEDTPGAAYDFFHMGTPQAAKDRAADLARERPPSPEWARTIEGQILVNPDEVQWVTDKGLMSHEAHMVGDRIPNPHGDRGMGLLHLNKEPLVPNSDIGWVRFGKERWQPIIAGQRWHDDVSSVGKDAADYIRDRGKKLLAYENDAEDMGSISIIPIGEHVLYKPDGTRIKEMATPVAGGGLLAAGSDAEAADFSTDYLHQLDEYVPEPKVGAVTKFIADMATDFAGWREQVNKDLQENPVAALASIPIGAIEEVWAGTNLALEGWTALDKFIDQNDDVRRVDQLLDKSYEYKDKFSDFFTEQGLPESWRTVGGITGVGGVATKGAKKGADILYDLYRLGL